MFAGLINQAKSAASHLVLKYVARASVAVPFVIAAGFLLGRNWPLVLFLAMIGALFWPTEDAATEEDVVVGRKPNGSDDHMPSALRH